MGRDERYWTLYRAAFKHIPLTEQEIEVIERLYREDGRDLVNQQIKRKKIVPAAAALFVKLGLDKNYWEPIVRKYRERNEQVVVCLNDVYKSLAEAGINQMGVVENFGALLQGEQDLCMFGSGDVDNYADLSQREQIYHVLKELGYTIEEEKRNDLLVDTILRNERVLPEKFYFGINWDVTCRINLPCLTGKGNFVDWDKSGKYKDTAIQIPPAEALMYICLMHIAVHGFCKAPDIRLYYDIANAAVKPLDWSEIKEWAIRDENCLRIAAAATLANRLLGVDVPNKIMELGNRQRRERLIHHVSDPERNMLRDFPGRLTSLGIDIFSCDGGIFSGLKYVFWPDREWIKKKYGSAGTGRIRHIFELM